MIDIHIKKKIKTFAVNTELEFDLEIKEGTFVSLYGKSGAGKTTLLKMLSGLVVPDEGHIWVNGECWFDKSKRINLSPQERDIGFVFQDFLLFPNMTVRESLEFVFPGKKCNEWIAYVVEMMEMNAFSDQKPLTLSGGQQQRAALARAIIRKPKLLLLDEPFSSLDPENKELLQERVKKIHNECNLTSIMVSHDKEEVSRLSDSVYELKEGKLYNHELDHLDEYQFCRFLNRDENSNTCSVELMNGKKKLIIKIKEEELLKINNYSNFYL